MKTFEHLLKFNARAELARRNLLDFVMCVKPGYDPNWHHALLCHKLKDFADGKTRRLMVFMPPQHGKSELVSRNLPAWILGRNPKTKIVLGSYSSTLASSFNRDCQRIIDSEAYREIFPKTFLSESNIVTIAGNWLRNSEIFETVGHGGFLKTVGVGGSLTGTPADIAIIDDPVKDSIEAQSPVTQQRIWEWYNDVLFTRTHNKSGILITQTRWDVNDLSGKLLKAMEDGTGERWEVLCLPAINETGPTDIDPREVGEALWPERHSAEKMHQIKKQSIRTFESLFQQNPSPVKAGGEFYKGFDLVRNTFTQRRVDGKPERYDPNLPLHITFDFNVNPYMTCCIWQLIGKKAQQIDEICLTSPRNTTRATCAEFASRYAGHTGGLYIYGDPSGMQEDTRSEKGFNDFVIIREQLTHFYPTLRVERRAPAVVPRGNFLNICFETGYQGIDIKIGQNCVNTTNDYLYLKEDSDGTKKKDKAKDLGTGVSYEKYGHTSDANDYFLCYVFAAEFHRYQKGGREFAITMGKNVSKNTY